MCSPYIFLYDYGLPKDIISIINLHVKQRNIFCFEFVMKCVCATLYCKHKLNNIKICANKLCDKMCCTKCYNICKCKQEYFCNQCFNHYICSYELIEEKKYSIDMLSMRKRFHKTR